VGLLLVIALSPAFAQVPAWVLYTHPDKLISVRFPAKPTQSEQEAPSPVGNIHFKMATLSDDNRAFVVTAVVYPIKSKFDVKAGLDGARDQMLANISGKVISEKPIKLDGFEGREVQYEANVQNKSIRGVARLFASAKPPSAFMAGAMQLNGKPDPDAQKFLDSIHLGKKVETKP
jgi:hypothetical protein